MSWADYEVAAKAAGVTTRTIRRWVQQGHIVSRRGKVNLDDIDEYRLKARRERLLGLDRLSKSRDRLHASSVTPTPGTNPTPG